MKKKVYKKIIRISMLLLLLLGISSIIYLEYNESDAFQFFLSAFSNEDERSIQKVYLINAFLKFPIFGSGFGVGADYVRNIESPWIYELSYHQILFNFGIMGASVLLLLFTFYFKLIFFKMKQNLKQLYITKPILIGIIGFLIGSYSNPYFGSFDFLFFIGLTPYLATISNSNE